MLIPIYYAKDAQVRLRTLLNDIEKEKKRSEATEIETKPETLKTFKNKFYTLTSDLMNALREILIALKQHSDTFSWIRHAQDIAMQIELGNRDLKDADIDGLEQIVNRVLGAYGEEDLLSLNNRYYYESRFIDMYGQYVYNTDFDQQILRNMVEHIKTRQDRRINVIDASMRNAQNMSRFKSYGDEEKIRTFALGAPEEMLEHYKNAGFDRIALGNLKGSTVSNEVFDVLMLSPYITIQKTSDRILEKKEKDMIKETIKYLRPGGYLILSLPRFRFYKDICTILAKGYKNIQVRKSADLDHGKFLYVLAERKANKEDMKEIDKDVYNLLRSAHSNEEIETVVDKPFEDVFLPDGEMEVKMFRGSILNKDELVSIFNSSPCMNQFLKGQRVNAESERKREPLLPFTTGQLGLVLTSGALDGIIDEGNGHYHVVKGRVVKDKQTSRDEDEDSNSITFTETVANRVEITAITADGTIKRLA